MDAAEARDIAHTRDNDAARQQIWFVAYKTGKQPTGNVDSRIENVVRIRAASHSDALRIAQEVEARTIDTARVKLSIDQVLPADNDPVLEEDHS